jgi:ABC-2 type transport system permease protein
MGQARLLLRQARYENRAFWRNPESAFFTFAFPLLFMVIINLVFASAAGPDGPSIVDFYTPAIITFAIVNANFSTLAMTVAIARDDGLLKRVRGTPLPTATYLGARVLHSILVGLLLAAIVAGFGLVAFGVEVPLDDLPVLIATLVLGSLSFAALGLAVAGLIPSSGSAPAIVNAIVLPLLFISNVFIRVEEGILVTLGEFFPIRRLADALLAIYHPDWAGPLDPVDLAWLAGWGLAGLLVAWRTFTWEPRA